MKQNSKKKPKKKIDTHTSIKDGEHNKVHSNLNHVKMSQKYTYLVGNELLIFLNYLQFSQERGHQRGKNVFQLPKLFTSKEK